MRCLSCHYNLSHLTEHCCPECGRAFDPNDPATFQSLTSIWQRWKKPLGVLALASCFLSLLFGLVMVSMPGRRADSTAPPPSLLETVLGAAFASLIALPFVFLASLLLYATFRWIAGWFKKTR